jgi:hypothetical protein
VANPLLFEIDDDKFTLEQKAYIRKYATGLLLAWAGPAVAEHITPDTADGFEPPDGMFSEDNLISDGIDQVSILLDSWLEEIVKIAGFSSKDHLALNSDTAYAKYPVMKNEV